MVPDMVPDMVPAEGNVHVPLVMPGPAPTSGFPPGAPVELTGNNVLVVPGADQQVEVVPGVWTAVEGGPGVPGAAGQAAARAGVPGAPREFAATQRAAEIVLKLDGGSVGDAAVVVDKAWIQTCVSRSAAARQDRAVLQFTTRPPRTGDHLARRGRSRSCLRPVE